MTRYVFVHFDKEITWNCRNAHTLVFVEYDVPSEIEDVCALA